MTNTEPFVRNFLVPDAPVLTLDVTWFEVTVRAGYGFRDLVPSQVYGLKRAFVA